MIVVGDVLINELHGDWHFLAVFVKFHVVQLQIEDVPLPAIDRLVSDSVFGFPVRYPRRSSVWLESLLVA